MYEGTNPTALRSQQWILDALLTMMKEKPYAAITVRDLCVRADLSRQTFYNLYDSKEDILHAYLRSEVEKVYSRLRKAERPQIGDMVEAFAEVLESNRENLRLMTRQGLGPIIAEEITAAVSLFAGSFVDRDEKEENDGKEMTYAVAFLSGGLAQTLLQWTSEDTPLQKDELTRILEKILQGEMYSL